MALLNLQNITLAHGTVPLLDSVSIQIHEKEKIALLGRNGAGKSTLMRVIAGQLKADGGDIVRDRNTRVAFLPQEVPDNLQGSVYSVIASGIEEDDDPLHESLHETEHRERIETVLSMLTLDPDPEFSQLSAGMKRRVLLGRALACDPQLLLLDEPTNHLDLDSIRWLEDFLARYDRSVFFVTHDRTFLQKIANRIIELDRGALFDWKCDYRTFLERKQSWLEAEELRNAQFDKKLTQEEAWLRRGIKARRTRDEGRVRALLRMREERSQRREVQGNVKMTIQQAERSGRLVVEAENISFGYSSEKRIIDNFSTTIMRGDKVGIIGPNGCGKSTLLKILLSQLEPQTGSVKTGTKLEPAYFDQLRDQLDPDKTVRDNIANGSDTVTVNGRPKHVVGYLQDFLFSPERTLVKTGLLSGGEKNRLLLARMFARPSNLLIMDEPTNDLDLETLDLLEDLLLEYEGTLIVVSHDREFLNNVVTSTIAFEGDGQVSETVGGYDDWLRARKTTTAPAGSEKKAPREKKPAQKKKLSFNENRELETLPGEIESLEARKQELLDTLADPALYQQGGSQAAEIHQQLEQTEALISEKTARWLELETLREELEEAFNKP